MHDVYKNINEYNPDKERKTLIVFDDMIADMINNKKLNSIVTELYIRGRKLSISIVFITQFEKQIKTTEDLGQKQVEALNTLKSNNQLTVEDVIPKSALNNDVAKNNLDKIKEIEKNVDREKLVYETNEYTYSFKKFQTIKTFGRDIYEGKIMLEKANEYQTNLLSEIIDFKKNTKPRSQEKKNKKKNCSSELA